MEPAPALLAQLSDPHVRVGPGDGSAARALAAAVEAVAALDPAPLAVLLTGDLAEHGATAEYERVRELLSPLTMPVHPLPGNHDARDELRAAFGDHPEIGGTGTFVHYSVRCGPLRVILCDTLEPGSDDGRLCPERLDWLAGELEREPDAPTVVAMHHPPLVTGIGALDDSLPRADRAALGELVGPHPGVQRLVAGHIHRTIAGALAGRPVCVCPSTWLQAALDLRGPGPLELIDEPPGFALHLYGRGDALITHVQPVRGGSGRDEG
jgi:Icc protein